VFPEPEIEPLVVTCRLAGPLTLAAALTVTLPLPLLTSSTPVVVLTVESSVPVSPRTPAEPEPPILTTVVFVVGCSVTLAAPEDIVPPLRVMLSAVIPIAAPAVLIVPAEWVNSVLAVVTERLTPVGPVTVFPMLIAPLEDRVTVEVDDVMAPEEVNVPVSTMSTTPPVAAACALTLPVLAIQISPEEESIERRVVAAVSMGTVDAPTRVAEPSPMVTVAALTVPAPAAYSVIDPVAFRTMEPEPPTVIFPSTTRFPPESSRRFPPEYSLRPKLAPTVTFPVV
jgi:hypothetical protein